MVFHLWQKSKLEEKLLVRLPLVVVHDRHAHLQQHFHCHHHHHHQCHLVRYHHHLKREFIQFDAGWLP